MDQRAEVQEQTQELRAAADEDGQSVGPGLIKYDVKVGRDELALVFRIPDLQDMAELDMQLPVLPTEGKSEEDLVAMVEDGRQQEAMEALLAKPEGIKNFMERSTKLLVICSHRPKLTEAVEPTDGSYPVRAIPSQTRIFLFMSIAGAAGFTAAAAKQVAPFVGAGPSSGPAMPSPGGTEEDQRTSLTPDAAGQSSSG